MNGSMIDSELNGLTGPGGGVALAPPSADRAIALPPELADLITEAVAMPATAAARAEVIGAILVWALDAVSWRQESVGDGTEESSLSLVVRAAEAHRQRMAADRLR